MIGSLSRIFLLVLFCLFLISSHSPFADPVDDFIDEDVDFEEILADIPPMDIMIADREMIAGLPFFNSMSAETIITLRDSLGTGETFLETVQSHTAITPIQREILFAAYQQSRKGKTSFFSGRIRSGFIHKPENETLADGKYYTSINTAFGNTINSGMVIERDPFEPDALDLMSFYSSVLFDKGRSRIVLGDFRPGFGQNLVFSRYSRNYISGLSVMSHESERIVNTQFEEASFLRGSHVTVNRGPLKVQAWGSLRTLDATLDDEGNAVTIRDSGIHESNENHNNLDETLFAGRVSFLSERGLSFGLAGVSAGYSPSLARKDGEQYLNDPGGSHFTNMSVDVSYIRDAMAVFIEHARNPNGSRATAGGIRIREHGIGASVLGREYTPRYWAPRSAGMSSFGNTANEKGIYSALKADLPYKIRAIITLDHARLLSRSFTHSMPISRRRVGCVVSSQRQNIPAWKIAVRSVDDSDGTAGRWNCRFHLKSPGHAKRTWKLESVVAWSESEGSGGPCLEVRTGVKRYGCNCILAAAVFDIPSYASRYYRYEYNVPGRGMSRPVWGKGGSIVCVVTYGPFSLRYRIADATLMDKSTELTLQSDIIF